MDRMGAAICRDGTWKQGCGWRRRRFWISTWGSDRTARWGSPRSDEPGQTMLASEGHTWCSSFLVPRSPQSSLGLTRCTGPGQAEGKPAVPVLPACLGLCQQSTTQPAAATLLSFYDPARPCLPQRPGRKCQGGVSSQPPTLLV